MKLYRTQKEYFQEDNDLKDKGGLVWEDKAVMVLPIEDYDLLKETYDMWLASCKEEVMA